MKLWATFRWYFKGLFPHPSAEILFFIVGLIQSFSLVMYKSHEAFIMTTQLLIIPLIGISNGMHIAREKSVTIFELSLLKSWRNIPLSKEMITFIGFIPLILIDLFITYYFGIIWYFPYIVLSVLVYSSLILIPSLMHSSSLSSTLLFFFLFILPTSSVVFIQNDVLMGYKIPVYMSIIIYILSPLFAYKYFNLHIISISPFIGIISICLFYIIVSLLYYIGFIRSQFKP